MFYEPKDGHGLPHNPFSAIVAPRPIGWISTRSCDGIDNLAPYSFFNALAYTPPQVIFGSTSRKSDRHMGKDTVANIDETGVFCVNIVEFGMRDAMNASSGNYDADIDEFELAGLQKEECQTIACPRVAGVPAALECRVSQILTLAGDCNIAVIGEVTGIHLRDDCLIDGRFDVLQFQPVARLGYRDYARIGDLFSLARPGE